MKQNLHKHDTQDKQVQLDRSELPKDLDTWRNVHPDDHAALWIKLHALLQQSQLSLWPENPHSRQLTLSHPSGYLKIPKGNVDVWVRSLKHFQPNNALKSIARDRLGQDVIVRLVTAGDQGTRALNILKSLTTAPGGDALLSDNHVLPFLEEIVWEDLTFLTFPRAGLDLCHLFAVTHIHRNSIEDHLYMLLEALEGIQFIHARRIAHMDLLLCNIVAEWAPQSLKHRIVARPRVYLIDFEFAISFPETMEVSDMTTTGLPSEVYVRTVPSEVQGGQTYCPFKLDMWQFGHMLQQFETELPEIDRIIASLHSDKPDDRPTASQALNTLESAIRAIPPQELHRPPVNHEWDPYLYV